MPEHESQLFARVLQLANPVARAAFLDQACAGNTELRGAVDALLAAHAVEPEFLERPAAQAPAPGTAAYEPAVPSVQATADFTGARPGRIIAGKYKLLQQIGEGGMGSVWMADQTEPVTRRVAVKLIRAERGESSTILARFAAERQAIALMDHPHIAKLLDAGTTEAGDSRLQAGGEKSFLQSPASSLQPVGTPYFVMELVKGIPLTEFCDTHKLRISERLQLFAQVCSAVQHAHQKGIIHRDLKPSNILVESHDGKPVPKVIDFGLAKATTGLKLTEHTLFTGFGSVLGTPQYMAPEQATFNAVDVDTRADIYALGVILYELLTGTTPLTRETIKRAQLDEMLRLIREQEAPTPSSRLSTSDSKPSVAANRQTEPAKLGRVVKGELDWIVLKALAKERDRRYETANGFAKDVERFLNHEPVSAGPPTAGYKLRKFIRRHRPQVIAASLVLLALLAGIAGTTWQAIRAEQARRDEAAQRVFAIEQRTQAEKAAAAEKAAREQTQKRLAQIEKGVELFAGMLAGINPRSEEKEGQPLYDQLRERVEKAADQLQAEAVGDPLVEARLQSTLGETLRELGSYARAIEVLERARATRERELGADHIDTLTTLYYLALAYQAAGRTAEAIALFERVRDALVKKVGADHPSTFATLNNLAGAYRSAGRTAEAIPIWEQVRDAQVKKLGADHADNLTTLNNLSLAYRDAGRTDEAIALLERVRDANMTQRGADHPSTLATLHNLALAYRAAGRTVEAIAILERVRDAYVKKLGADYPLTLATLHSLAWTYRVAGRTDEAIAILERVRDAYEKKLGADHPNTLNVLSSLADTYRAAGRTAEAIALFERVRDAQVTKLGADHPDTLTTLNNLAVAYWSRKSLDQSIPLFEDLRALQEKKLGRQHSDTLLSVANLGVNYRDAGRLAEAIPLLEEAYRAAKTHPTLRVVGPELLDAYRKAGKSAEAARLIGELLVDARKQLPQDSPQLAEQLAQFGLQLLEVKGFTQAEPLLRECLAIREKKQPDDWTTFNTKSLLGGALLGQKKYAEAEPLLLQGYEGMKQRIEARRADAATLAAQKPRLTEALERLVLLYEATGKKDEAVKWRQELQAVKAPTKPPNKK